MGEDLVNEVLLQTRRPDALRESSVSKNSSLNQPQGIKKQQSPFDDADGTQIRS